MGPVRTPYMRTFEDLIRALESERNTFAAGNVMDRARAKLIELHSMCERKDALIADLRARSLEEGIHHFVMRIDAALSPSEREERK